MSEEKGEKMGWRGEWQDVRRVCGEPRDALALAVRRAHLLNGERLQRK